MRSMLLLVAIAMCALIGCPKRADVGETTAASEALDTPVEPVEGVEGPAVGAGPGGEVAAPGGGTGGEEASETLVTGDVDAAETLVTGGEDAAGAPGAGGETTEGTVPTNQLPTSELPPDAGEQPKMTTPVPPVTTT